MESLATVNRMQEYAQWSLLANKAQYALDLFLRRRQLEGRAEEYLRKGLDFCKTLQKGLATDRQMVNVSQLGALNMADPVENRVARNEEDIKGKLEMACNTIQSILNPGVYGEVSSEQIDQTIDLFDLLIESYTDKVFDQIDALKKGELTHT